MKSTRILALGLGIALSMSAFAFAATTPATVPAATSSKTTQQAQTPVVSEPVAIPATSVKQLGKVTNIDTKNNTITIQTDDKQTIVLNTDKDTYFVDNTTQKANAFKDVKLGETIHVWHSLAMTRSMPPQTYAQLIISNVKENQAVGQLYEVVDATANKDGGYVLLNNERDLFATLPKELDKLPLYGSKDATVASSEIKPGTKLVVWYSIVAESFPAQTNLQSAIALPYSYDGYVLVQSDNKVITDGKTANKPAVTKDNEYFVPVMSITKEWGYKSSWDKTTGTLTLTQGKNKVVLQKGSTKYTVNGEEYETKAPFIQNKVFYVSPDVIQNIGTYKVVVPMEIV